MTALLASVATGEEVETALAGGADIVDLKDPSRGALSALPLALARDLIRQVAGRAPVSAVTGDIPFAPESLLPAVRATAEAGADIVKVGVFPGTDALACIEALAGPAAEGLRLVAVLFADRKPDFALLPALARAGFLGAMLDTADKAAGPLRRHQDEAALAGFVAACRSEGLLCGLAGSLRLADVAPLRALAPDYLGFRGGLTAGRRDAGLDPAAIAAIRAALPRGPLSRESLALPVRQPAASSATAAAGAEWAAARRSASGPSTSSAKST